MLYPERSLITLDEEEDSSEKAENNFDSENHFWDAVAQALTIAYEKIGNSQAKKA